MKNQTFESFLDSEIKELVKTGISEEKAKQIVHCKFRIEQAEVAIESAREDLIEARIELLLLDEEEFLIDDNNEANNNYYLQGMLDKLQGKHSYKDRVYSIRPYELGRQAIQEMLNYIHRKESIFDEF